MYILSDVLCPASTVFALLTHNRYSPSVIGEGRGFNLIGGIQSCDLVQFSSVHFNLITQEMPHLLNRRFSCGSWG